MYTFSSWFAVV